MSMSIALASLVALGGGLYAAYVDFHNMEVQAPMLVILLASFIAGALYPRLAWLWALVVAACLTALHLIAPSFGVHPIDTNGGAGNPLSLMFVALPAAVSAYLGAGVRWVLSRTASI